MKTYALRVLIGLDQFVNTIAGGYPNETLSARAWRKGSIEGNGAWKAFQQLTDTLFYPLQSNHCKQSYIHFQKPTKTCGVYYPIYSEPMPPNRRKALPIDLPPFAE